MKPGQSTFDERISRINSGRTMNASDVVKHSRVKPRKSHKTRRLHLDMLVAGSLAGGTAGILFAMNVGLAFLVTLTPQSLYELALSDYLTTAFVAGVVLAPFGLVLGLLGARSNPRGWQFWLGYLGGVIAANWTELNTDHATLLAELSANFQSVIDATL